MLLLAVDTSTRAGSVAVLRDGVLLGVRVSCSTQPHASGLFVDLQGLLDELSLPIATFDVFAVAAGPGSFTGLRIGLTAVKGWSEVFGRPVVSVSSLEAIGVQTFKMRDLPAGGALAAVQDARRGQVFGRVYDYTGAKMDCLAALGEEVLLPAGEFVDLVAGEVGTRETIFASPAAEPIRSALQGSPLSKACVEVVSPVLAPFIGEIGYARALRGEVIDALHLDANYVRRTDAEVKWKDAGRKDTKWPEAQRKDRLLK